MEPSDEELGAFNQSECQRLLGDRRQWALQEEVGMGQDLVPAPAHGGGGAGWTQGARADSGIGSARGLLCGPGQVSSLLWASISSSAK